MLHLLRLSGWLYNLISEQAMSSCSIRCLALTLDLTNSFSLQIKNIIFHAVKDAIGALKKYENTRSNGEEETEKVEDKHEVEDNEETKEEL